MDPFTLDACIAFTRLLGYLRHWYPDERTANVCWEGIAVRGFERMLATRSREELVSELRRLVAEHAPLAQILDGEENVAAAAAALKSPPTPAHQWVTRWKHRGWYEGHPEPVDEHAYHNELLTASAAAVAPEELPPACLYIGTLSDGLRLALPLALWSDKPDPVYRFREPGERHLEQYDLAQPAARLAGVALAWNVIQHFAPEMERATEDWLDVLRRTIERAYADVDVEAFSRTLQRMLVPLRDAHGTVQIPVNRTRYRVPWLLQWVGDRLAVTWAKDAQPVEPGDVIESINGTPVLQLLDETRPVFTASTEDYLRSLFEWTCLRSDSRGPMTLDISRGGCRRTVQCTPEEIWAPKSTLGRLEPATELDDGVWYVDLWRTESEMLQEIGERLARAPGIVFDMRRYPTSFEVLEHISDTTLVSPWWLSPTPGLPDRVSMTYVEENWIATPEPPRYSRNIAFLTGSAAISAAETLMGIIEGNGVAPIFGNHTCGTNGDISRIFLPGGLTVIFTGLKVLKQDRTVHNGVGVIPTHRVLPTLEGIAAGKDEVLEAALEYLRGEGMERLRTDRQTEPAVATEADRKEEQWGK